MFKVIWKGCPLKVINMQGDHCVKLPGYPHLWWGIDTQRWYQFAFCMWLLHGFPDEQETGCVIVLSVCRNMIGDVWYDDVEVAQLPETNNASRREMPAEEKRPDAAVAAVSLDAIKWIN